MKQQPSITIANFITFKAKPGKATELANLLAGGAVAVVNTEPQTLGWYSVQIDAQTFAIIDFFANQTGQEAHLNGQVAALLKSKSDELIEGGWENGVIKNFQVMNVLSAAS